MPGFFVTGSGTDIGKTYVTAGLLRRWRAAGRRARALKPVVSGFDAAAAAASDPGMLLQAMGEPVDAAGLDRVAPFRFAAALSPDMAAAREHRQLDYAALVSLCRAALAEAKSDPILIEGIGGVMTPLDERRTVLDLLRDLDLPVLLVAGSYLGSISHCLTAATAVRRAELTIAALVVNESADSTVPLAAAAATIGRFVAPVTVIALPRAAPPGSAAFAAIMERLPC